MKRCPNCMDYIEKKLQVCPFCGYTANMKPTSKNHLAPGTTLFGKKYTLGKVLGQGGFGITYNAWDEINYRHVAIKEFFPNSMSYRSTEDNSVICFNAKSSKFFNDGKTKLLNEGAALSRFSYNDNIVNVYSFFEENNTAYIVMEYLDGINLSEFLKQNNDKLAPEKAIEIIFSVLNALSDMHSADLIHRDISPDNIYICFDGTVKLLDFGSARLAVTDSHKSLSVFVKPGYAPKEQYATHGNQGPWTDIYAVCATLYRMITGEIPVESLVRESEPLKSFSQFGIPPKYASLEKIIFKGLEPDIKHRTKSAEELYNQLYSFLYGEPKKIKKLSDSLKLIFHRSDTNLEDLPDVPINNELPVTETKESDRSDSSAASAKYSVTTIDNNKNNTDINDQSDISVSDPATENKKNNPDKKTLKQKFLRVIEHLFAEYKEEIVTAETDKPAVTLRKDDDSDNDVRNKEEKPKKEKTSLKTIVLQIKFNTISLLYRLFVKKSQTKPDDSADNTEDNKDKLNIPVAVVTFVLCIIAITFTLFVGAILS